MNFKNLPVIVIEAGLKKEGVAAFSPLYKFYPLSCTVHHNIRSGLHKFPNFTVNINPAVFEKFHRRSSV